MWLGAETECPEIIELEMGQMAVYTRRCPGKDTPNEDGALIVPVDGSRVVLAVADGCGGMQAGDEASKLTLKALSRAVGRDNRSDDQSLRAAILDGIERANARVCDLAVGAATTLAIAEIVGDRLRTFHIGDSQIVLVSNRGRLKLVTPPHSPVGYALEAGLLSPDEAMIHEDRHLVSNVVGSEDCYIEVGMRRRAAKRDTLVLATDGVFDNLHIDEVGDIVRRGELKNAAIQLAKAVDERVHSEASTLPSKPDDVTFIIFRWN